MTDATPTTQSSARRLTGTHIGVVVADKRDKTCTVNVDHQLKHRKYGKYLRRQSRIQVHDPANASRLGDRVEIVNCRPISKTKSWRLVRIVAKGPSPEAGEVSS